MERIYNWLADHMPRRLVYLAAVRLITEGSRFHSMTVDCDKALTPSQCLRYWNWKR